MKFAIGTYNEERDTPIEPFLFIDSLDDGEMHTYPSQLYLYAFRSNGYLAGQYREDINDLVGDSLLPDGKGLPVSKLSPLTTWVIKPLGGGRLGVVAGKNAPEDIKQYKHDFKLHQSAKGQKA